MDLDALPLDVLLALQEALTDPTRAGAERARLRAAGAGFHLKCANPEDPDGRIVLARVPEEAPPPTPMPEASPGEPAIELRFEPRRPRAERRRRR